MTHQSLFPQEYNGDKTTHFAGLLGTWSEIIYEKNSVRCLVYSQLSVNITLSPFPFVCKPLVLVMLEKTCIAKPLLVTNLGRMELVRGRTLWVCKRPLDILVCARCVRRGETPPLFQVFLRHSGMKCR